MLKPNLIKLHATNRPLDQERSHFTLDANRIIRMVPWGKGHPNYTEIFYRENDIKTETVNVTESIEEILKLINPNE